jgi:acetyl-CoA/propionyl-CoA carboxylase, biotin carboxylase, biotin carboxyl carrier protein
MIESVLIANRGEVAVRLIRAYRELGVRAIAVYSDADASALHVRLADEAHRIGPAPACDSYLNHTAILAAAAVAKATAVDPGYGLLSEDAAFARAVIGAGLVFIGPPADAIAAMGDKVAARAIAVRAGVPVVPGSGVIANPEAGLRAGRKLGFPLVVKSPFGGGGRGMRIVADESRLADALTASAAEAASAFGRPEVYLERHVREARHIEVQVLADAYGNVLHLGDRDCSLQRRYQKLVEEAPAPFLDDHVRERMHAAALSLAADVGYRSTGTVEFLYEPASRQFYFLEMNTRLQVEHGVTELVTGLDLVAERLAIAAGQPLAITQDDVCIRGHAIEVRLTAEDPWQRFLPRPGMVTALHIPAGAWLRADFGVAAGDNVPSEYDSMFGKLMAWGPDRESARRRLIAALGEFRLSGLPTTATYLQDVLRQPAFGQGTHSTTWLEENWPPEGASRPAVSGNQSEPAGDARAQDATMAVRLVEVHAAHGTFRVAIPSRQRRVTTGGEAGQRSVAGRAADGSPDASRQPTAPMDGVVVKVEVQPGDLVERHAAVTVIESMKMQIPVTAPWPGEVRHVLVEVGEAVTAGQQVAEIGEAP